MKEAAKKYWATVLVFVSIVGVCLLFCYRKQGLFIDEIYTYGLSNSYYAPYLTDIKDGSLIDKTVTRAEVEAYLSVGDEDAFRFDSVYHNLKEDVHPPLYYWIFHFVSSLVRGSCSKWIGLGINAVLFLLTCIALYALAEELYGSTDVSCAVTALYGMSVLGLSTVTMIRMYMLLTLFTVLLALTVAHLLHNPEKREYYFCLAAVLFGGMMTQYYFVFYAFFLCAAFDIAMLLRKEYRCALRFSLFALAGVGLMVCAFRASLQQVFLGNGQAVGGISVLDALRKTATYGERLGSFWEKVKLMLRGMRWAAAGAAVCILLSVRKLPGLIRNKRIPFDALVILLPLPCAYIVSVLIAPLQAQELRYIYNLTPIAAAGIGFLLCLPDRSLGEARYGYVIRKAAVLLVFSAALLSAKAKPPATLFVEQPQYIALAQANAGRKCVYLTDGPRAFGPLTQDLLELKCFPDFFVTNDTASAALKEYLGDADSAVLYISTNDYWTDGYGFDPEDELRSFGEDTGLTESGILYRYDFEGQGGLSETYLMKGMKP